MIRNWYELPSEELKQRKAKLLDLFMDLGSKHPKSAKLWKAMDEIEHVLELREVSKENKLLQMSLETLT